VLALRAETTGGCLQEKGGKITANKEWIMSGACMSGKRMCGAASSIHDGPCMDCGIDTMARDERYMLRDTVWRSINPVLLGHLCFRCAEDRLGRSLHRGDFSTAPVNRIFAARCAALAERLERARPKPGGADRTASASAIQARLAKKKRTQSVLGRLSAALLPHRGRNGRVPQGTLTRLLRELIGKHAPTVPQSDLGAKSVGRRKRIDRRR
jgi:hypothetical protein